MSWIYYLTFIFFTAFLNMAIGIVVNVMEEEHVKVREDAILAHQEDQMQLPLLNCNAYYEAELITLV